MSQNISDTHDNVTKLPTSPYAASMELHNDLRRVVSCAWDGGFKSGQAYGWHAGYDHGFAIGEEVARQECANSMTAARDKALGIGLLVGSGFGVALAVLVGSLL